MFSTLIFTHYPPQEKREQDEVKRRELAEFMATQPGYKGGNKGAGANRWAMFVTVFINSSHRYILSLIT